MNDDKDKKPEEEEARTIFVPSGTAAPGVNDGADPVSPAPPASQTPAEPAADASVPAVPQPPAAEAPPTAETPAPPAAAEPPSIDPNKTANFAPHGDAIGIKVGDVLNHIFEVRRFLARGGMGEVFDGVNVHTDERVAIKVMLPALANDEKVIAMFRKEAKTLTKLHHQALVGYRVLAQEPQSHVLYIVTDFIEGTNLGEAMPTLKPTPEQLAGLLRRLASGLGAAHQLGAVHRDMSPDNVILQNDDVLQAKIIDFGIAKDLEASSATIVGDGFAGKLNYVAPEQLGDFGREVGPWTDVYSLGLVILAVAQGKNVDMSGSLVDAIDKRRRGPDLSAIPDNLRPLLEAMLRPNPAERLRSMDDVIAMLDGAGVPLPPPPPTPPDGKVETARTGQGGSKLPLIIGLVALLLLVAAGVYVFRDRIPFLRSGGDSGNMQGGGGGGVTPPTPPANPIEAARAAINSTLPSVSCTWLDIGGIENGAGGMTISMRGVAGDENVARDQIRAALAQAGTPNATVNFDDVAQITQAGCAALDAYRQIRSTQGGHLTTPQTHYEEVLQQDGRYAGRMASNPLLDLNLDDPTRDIALLGIEPSGQITVLLPSRAQFEQVLASSTAGRPISREGNNRFRIHVDSDHSGWSGFLLITGRGPFDANLIAPGIGSRDPAWRDRFLSAASGGNWTAEMVWYNSVPGSGDASTPAVDDQSADSADDDK
jgi:serine/threonine-protein kinase